MGDSGGNLESKWLLRITFTLIILRLSCHANITHSFVGNKIIIMALAGSRLQRVNRVQKVNQDK